MWLILAMQICSVLNNNFTPGIKNILVYNVPQWYAVQGSDARTNGFIRAGNNDAQ